MCRVDGRHGGPRVGQFVTGVWLAVDWIVRSASQTVPLRFEFAGGGKSEPDRHLQKHRSGKEISPSSRSGDNGFHTDSGRRSGVRLPSGGWGMRLTGSGFMQFSLI